MATSVHELYSKYKELQQKAADLNNAAAVLGWDQEVYMPAKGAEARARQLATLATQAHEILTGKEYETVLLDLSGKSGLTDAEAANVHLSLEDFEKNRKLPAAFIDMLSRQTSECFNGWVEARRKNDYSIFEPLLAKMIALKQQQAELYGYNAHPYDALLDDYEKGMTVSVLDPLFSRLKEQLPPILQGIAAKGQVADNCFHQHFPKQAQWDFSMEVLGKMGFDFEAGRQDYAEHPFTTSFSPEDVRLTTRADEENFAYMLWSSIHEGGHGLYEQGLPLSEYGLPLGSAASLGIHESQSRLWENCVGRGREFWHYFYPVLQQYFPEPLRNITLDTWFKAMNKVSPSLIRTEADELTYHFHVMIRYEIEKGLLTNSISPKNLREAWNEHYKTYLGLTPPDDVRGILQDVHWSHGSFGYFPTYSLGSFYAAQFYARAKNEMPGLSQHLSSGKFDGLLAWLRKNVHQYGRRFTSEELCKQITGEGLNVDYFMAYVTEKYALVYS